MNAQTHSFGNDPSEIATKVLYEPNPVAAALKEKAVEAAQGIVTSRQKSRKTYEALHRKRVHGTTKPEAPTREQAVQPNMTTGGALRYHPYGTLGVFFGVGILLGGLLASGK